MIVTGDSVQPAAEGKFNHLPLMGPCGEPTAVIILQYRLVAVVTRQPAPRGKAPANNYPDSVSIVWSTFPVEEDRNTRIVYNSDAQAWSFFFQLPSSCPSCRWSTRSLPLASHG
jgi:hypothetical protein